MFGPTLSFLTEGSLTGKKKKKKDAVSIFRPIPLQVLPSAELVPRALNVDQSGTLESLWVLRNAELPLPYRTSKNPQENTFTLPTRAWSGRGGSQQELLRAGKRSPGSAPEQTAPKHPRGAATPPGDPRNTARLWSTASGSPGPGILAVELPQPCLICLFHVYSWRAVTGSRLHSGGASRWPNSGN